VNVAALSPSHTAITPWGEKQTGEGVRGVVLGFWCLSGAICMQIANISGGFFARSMHSVHWPPGAAG